jgi:hypothetical protein
MAGLQALHDAVMPDRVLRNPKAAKMTWQAVGPSITSGIRAVTDLEKTVTEGISHAKSVAHDTMQLDAAGQSVEASSLAAEEAATVANNTIGVIEGVEGLTNLADDVAITAIKKPNLNANNAVSEFGLYEIEIGDELHKIGKADLTRVTQSSGLPTRLHAQLRKLGKMFGAENVKGEVVETLGETTTEAAKAAETARIQRVVDETGSVPPGNQKSFKVKKSSQ